jgi:hypothetical protein
VRIVNRKTGFGVWAPGSNVTWGRGSIIVRVEAASGFHRIRCQQPGQYLALTDWAAKGEKAPRGHPGTLRMVTDLEDRSVSWKFEPLGDGYWRIVNRANGQCISTPNPKGVCPLAAPRDGDLEQQWRFEPVK